jgi:predicted DNA-binding transcriptional regulator AlpA
MLTTEYLRRDEAAKFLGMSKSTLANWASEGRGPIFHKVGRIPVYAVTELRRFVEANTVTPLA